MNFSSIKEIDKNNIKKIFDKADDIINSHYDKLERRKINESLSDSNFINKKDNLIYNNNEIINKDNNNIINNNKNEINNDLENKINFIFNIFNKLPYEKIQKIIMNQKKYNYIYNDNDRDKDRELKYDNINISNTNYLEKDKNSNEKNLKSNFKKNDNTNTNTHKNPIIIKKNFDKKSNNISNNKKINFENEKEEEEKIEEFKEKNICIKKYSSDKEIKKPLKNLINVKSSKSNKNIKDRIYSTEDIIENSDLNLNKLDINELNVPEKITNKISEGLKIDEEEEMNIFEALNNSNYSNTNSEKKFCRYDSVKTRLFLNLKKKENFNNLSQNEIEKQKEKEDQIENFIDKKTKKKERIKFVYTPHKTKIGIVLYNKINLIKFLRI
jgi:hypothetical protein